MHIVTNWSRVIYALNLRDDIVVRWTIAEICYNVRQEQCAKLCGQFLPRMHECDTARDVLLKYRLCAHLINKMERILVLEY